MARSFRNDPGGLSNDPVVVTAAARQQAVGTEFTARLTYIQQHYWMMRGLMSGECGFSRSLTRLKAAKNHPPNSGAQRRLHPEIELVICKFAQDHAFARGHRGPLAAEDVAAGVSETLERIKPAHRPQDRVLRHHIFGLIALVQDISGMPVRARRYSDYDYDPRPFGWPAQMVVNIFRHIDPSILSTRIIRLIDDARKEWAGERKTFSDYFPMYGCAWDGETGVIRPGNGRRVEVHQVATPLFCR